MDAPDPDRRYTADEVASLANVPRRTLRYYIQLGLVDPPIGETRAAYYSWQHLGRLLQIRELTESGLSLEAVRDRLVQGSAEERVRPTVRPGVVSVKSHIHLADGVELVIDPAVAGLSTEQVRRFAKDALALLRRASGTKE